MKRTLSVPRGLSVRPEPAGREATMGVTAVKATVDRCDNGNGSRVQLGLLANSEIDKHCTGITAGG